MTESLLLYLWSHPETVNFCVFETMILNGSDINETQTFYEIDKVTVLQILTIRDFPEGVRLQLIKILLRHGVDIGKYHNPKCPKHNYVEHSRKKVWDQFFSIA
jgi:hypothetical protein